MSKERISLGNGDENKHKCYAEREGDWIVFRCLICDDFERRINLVTRQMESTIDPGNMNLHTGMYIKPGLDTGLYSPN